MDVITALKEQGFLVRRLDMNKMREQMNQLMDKEDLLSGLGNNGQSQK